MGTLRAASEARASAHRQEFDLALDPADGAGISWLHRHAQVLQQSMRSDGQLMVSVRVEPEKAELVRRKFQLSDDHQKKPASRAARSARAHKH